ncbi:MAG: D-glycerate dehydrogenase [Acidobacteria bacterium]|nr:D-glycerate dehydrogenase [Acidobacteriota bacterium]
MRVVATARLPAIAAEILAPYDYHEYEWTPTQTRERLVEKIGSSAGVIAVLGDRFDEEIFSSCPSLKIVSNFAVGFDNVDLAAAARHGVWVTNTPGVLTDATADLAMTLLLAVTRRVVEGHRMMQEDRYVGWHPLDHLGFGLQGKTLGIVGMGRIGRAMAHRASAFGMSVIFSSRTMRESEGAFTCVSLDELLSRSDVVSIHCPLNAETKRLFDSRRLSSMKRGAYLINTARGAIVDESALAEALENGRLGGAGLDVFENEPHAHPALRGRNDVVLLPHIGSATVETRSEMARLAALNVAAVLEGERPPHPVNELVR